MASSQHSMSHSDREFLRRHREYLKGNLMVNDVLIRMTDVFSKNDEDLIRAESTPQERVLKLLELLPFRGSEAFKAFIIATYKVQEWLGKDLAEKARIDLNDILPNEENPGMKKEHQDILRKYLPQFNEKLDVKKMVTSLKEAKIMKPENQSPERVTTLIDLLPKLGPKAFDGFFDALRVNQLQFAHELEQLIKQSHPTVKLGTKCYQESASNNATNKKYMLSTPCSELPEEVFVLCEECLDKPIEVLENDWKRFYKVLKLPEGKENIIAEKDGSSTRQVLNLWIDRDGKQVTVKKLLEVLVECRQGGLAHKIEQVLGVELPEQPDGCDLVDGVGNMRVEESRKKKPIKYVKDIPQDLKRQFIDRLNRLGESVLSTIATAVEEERCYVRDAEDFLKKIEDNQTRILFRELRKENQCDVIVKWMRDKFPAGSTGPMKSEDELRAGEMNYGSRLDVTKILTANGYWKTLAAHKDIDLKALDIALLEKAQASKDPSESVLSHWEVSTRSTVGTMYDLLVDCGFNDVADHL